MWVPNLFGKQWDVFNAYDRALLLSGSRLAAKSWAALHRIVRHLWETPDARVGMFTKVLKNSKDAGMWKNMHNYTLKEWIKAGIGLKYTTKDYDGRPGPKVDGTTRTPFFRITNLHGGESEAMLFSLDNDNEAEAKLKEREFSMIYFSELSNFSMRSVLSLGLLALRMPHLNFNQQMWLADTNPSDEGEHSWIYECWYIEQRQSYPEYVDRQRKLNRPVMEESDFESFKENTRLIEMFGKDNIRLKPGQLKELAQAYAYDPGMHARFVDGQWVYGGGESSRHFRRFFKPNIHVAGSAVGPEEDWEYLNPSPKCVALTTGYDLGETNNHAAIIMEKQMLSTYMPDSKMTVPRAHFHVLDELVSIGEFVNLEDFTAEFMQMIAVLEKYTEKTLDLSEAYSDSSTLTKWSASSSNFPSQIVEAASFGRLMLIGVNKAVFTPRWRVQILQQLLAFNRIKISAHCYHVLRMLKDLRKGEGRLNFVLQSDDNRHVFDSLTYALIASLEEELVTMPRQDTGRRQGLNVSIR